MSETTIADYVNAKKKQYGKSQSLTKDLSQYEQALLEKNMLMKIISKNSKVVSVIVPQVLTQALDLLIGYRYIADLDEKNEFLFGADNATGFVTPGPLFRQFSEKYGLKQPLLMRGTNLREHLATTMHAFSTSEHDLERIANFMVRTLINSKTDVLFDLVIFFRGIN